jgi:hypothetical protein
MQGSNLLFANAYTSYHWDFISQEQKGYACIFAKDFRKMFDHSNIIQESRIF